jgi:hypothetical protein
MDSETSDAGRLWVLTQEGQRQVWRALWTFCTSIFGVERNSDRPEYIGSGTFVAVGGASCLLTAAHLWHRLATMQAVGLALENERPPIWVPIEALWPRVMTVITSDEWGPDIALVSFHKRDVDRLATDKAFYDVLRPRAQTETRQSRRWWALAGASAELSTIGEQEALLKSHVLASSEARQHGNLGIDYVDLPYGNMPRVDIPVFWGGLSGAGLWRCDVTPTDEGDLSITPVLCGVAFYQVPGSEPRQGAIRCHGPNSLRELGFDRVIQ